MENSELVLNKIIENDLYIVSYGKKEKPCLRESAFLGLGTKHEM